MKYRKIYISACLLILSICMYVNVLRIYNTTDEHLTSIEHLTSDSDRFAKLEAQINALKSSKPRQLVIQKKNYISQPTITKNGTYISSGALSNGAMANMIMTRDASTGPLPPHMISKPGFLKSQHTWFYDKHGSIRNKWDSVNNQMGSCLYKEDTLGKCSDPTYKSSVACIGNKKTWYETVGLTKNHGKCSSWTWDSYGRILFNKKGSSGNHGYKKCLIPLKTTTDQIIAGVENCTDNKIAEKHLWSFH